MSIFKDRFPFVKARTSSQPFARSEAPYPRAKRIPTITQTLLRVVRLTGIIILLGFLHVSAGINAQERISINMKSARLEKVFAEIEQRSGYTVFYNTEVLKYSGPITVEMKDATIVDVMRQVLKGLPLEFNIQDKTIFVKHVKPSAASSDSEGPGKNGAIPSTVSGVVQNEAGQPLVGATVYIRKLKKTGVTDMKGEVSLKDVPDGEYDVEVSYVGFERFTTKITVVNHEAVFSAALKQMMSKLDETVVKGYYTTTNRLNTGDVTTVSGEDIQKQPVSDPIMALEGRVPGMQIQQTSGVPGTYSAITIRGENSISNGNDPLYIVDGVPYSSVSLTNPLIGGGAAGIPNAKGISNVEGGFQGGGGGLSPFNNLNPSDIESIEVLKDADATAIYGSRGANGVVLITTKKGKVGKTKFDMNVFTGAGKPTRQMKLLNTRQYLEMRREAFTNDGLPLPSINNDPYDYNYDIDGVWDTTRYTNWQKVLIGNPGNFTNAQGELSGGNSTTQFVVGGGYSRQGTVFPGNYADQKASAHINLTHASENQRLHAQFTINYVNDNSNLPQFDFTSQATLAPDAPALYQSDGSLNWQNLNGTFTFNNPLANLPNQARAVTDNLIGSMNLAYEILPGFQIKTNMGFTHSQMNQSISSPSTSDPPPYNVPSNDILEIATTDSKSWIVEPELDFRKKIGKGQLNILVGSTFQENTRSNFSIAAYGFTSDALLSNPLAASTVQPVGSNSVLYHYDAAYGRIGYNWEEKYLINLTARRDGSSRFGPGKQFGNFGAIGAGWIFSKEPIVENSLPILSFGKLRASYGTTGNDQIADYQYLSTYIPSGTTYQGVPTLNPTGLTNPFFAWEVVKKMEGGLDLGFVKDRILFGASYFRNRTGNQLVGFSLPLVTGFSSVQFNLPAVVQNSGVEITLHSTNIRTKNFTWTSAINLTVPENKLVAFPNLANFPGYSSSLVVGKSLFLQHLYHSTGVNPQTGIYTFETKNASGVPSNPQDLVTTKSMMQKFYGGIANDFSYKGLQLDIFIQFVSQPGHNYLYSVLSPGSFNYNEPVWVLSRWQSSGQLTNIQRFGQDANTSNIFNNDFQKSDGVVSDASYLRLKNVALSYEIPRRWISQAHFQSARIYVQCQNLFTITHYLGLDPETGGLGLPPLRMITGGLRVGL